MDFAEGTRLVRVVPDVPVGVASAPSLRSRAVSVVPDARPDDAPAAEDDDLDGFPTDALAIDDLAATGPVHAPLDDEHVRDVHAPIGSPDDDRSVDDLLDEVADHDTVVLGRSADGGRGPPGPHPGLGGHRLRGPPPPLIALRP